MTIGSKKWNFSSLLSNQLLQVLQAPHQRLQYMLRLYHHYPICRLFLTGAHGIPWRTDLMVLWNLAVADAIPKCILQNRNNPLGIDCAILFWLFLQHQQLCLPQANLCEFHPAMRVNMSFTCGSGYWSSTRAGLNVLFVISTEVYRAVALHNCHNRGMRILNNLPSQKFLLSLNFGSCVSA